MPPPLRLLRKLHAPRTPRRRVKPERLRQGRPWESFWRTRGESPAWKPNLRSFCIPAPQVGCEWLRFTRFCGEHYPQCGEFSHSNFVVEAATPALARQVAEQAESYHKQLAMHWLGAPLPLGEPLPDSGCFRSSSPRSRSNHLQSQLETFKWKWLAVSSGSSIACSPTR